MKQEPTKIVNLNLSYNRMSIQGAQELRNVMSNPLSGLVSIDLEGNALACRAITQLCEGKTNAISLWLPQLSRSKLKWHCEAPEFVKE